MIVHLGLGAKCTPVGVGGGRLEQLHHTVLLSINLLNYKNQSGSLTIHCIVRQGRTTSVPNHGPFLRILV